MMFRDVERAEVLAAMDCIMHHLKEKDDLKRWTACALKESEWTEDWHILYKSGFSDRQRRYFDEAEEMSDSDFEYVVGIFAAIIRNQCFCERHRKGALEFSKMKER